MFRGTLHDLYSSFGERPSDYRRIVLTALALEAQRARLIVLRMRKRRKLRASQTLLFLFLTTKDKLNKTLNTV